MENKENISYNKEYLLTWGFITTLLAIAVFGFINNLPNGDTTNLLQWADKLTYANAPGEAMITARNFIYTGEAVVSALLGAGLTNRIVDGNKPSQTE